MALHKQHVVAFDLGHGDESTYIFDLQACNDVIAVSGSNHDIKIYQQTPVHVTLRQRLRGHTSNVNDLSFDRQDPNLLWSCSSDGFVTVWDLRTGSHAQNFQDPAQQDPVLSLSVNSEHAILAVGTSLNPQDMDVKLKFWDLRSSKLLSEFRESHNDDITKVRFHPVTPNFLVSSSEDGLVGFYALNHNLDEDESLESVLNTGQNVSRLGFFGEGGEFLFCTTNVETLELWHPMQARKIRDFGDIRTLTSNLGKPMDYAIDCSYDDNLKQLHLVAGTYGGDMEVFEVTMTDLLPRLSLSGGHQDRVRCVQLNASEQRVISGGEDSRICIWGVGEQQQQTSSKIRGRSPQANKSPGSSSTEAPSKKSFSPY